MAGMRHTLTRWLAYYTHINTRLAVLGATFYLLFYAGNLLFFGVLKRSGLSLRKPSKTILLLEQIKLYSRNTRHKRG